MPKSDILKKLEDTIKKKELGGKEALNAKEFVEALEDFVSHKDSKSRLFSARFHPLDGHDEGVVILKFASAKKKDKHNDIMKNAKTKFIISVDGFDNIGRCKGNGKCRLNLFHKMNRNGERREWDEKKHVNTDGTHSEILRHLLGYLDKNLVGFTDSAIRYIKGEETENMIENAPVAPPSSAPVESGTGTYAGNEPGDSENPTKPKVEPLRFRFGKEKDFEEDKKKNGRKKKKSSSDQSED
jgi:hypothetical protein